MSNKEEFTNAMMIAAKFAPSPITAAVNAMQELLAAQLNLAIEAAKAALLKESLK